VVVTVQNAKKYVTGLYVFLALSSIYFLWRQPAHNVGRRILLAYTVVMLGLNSSFLVLMATWTRALLSVESYRSSSDATVLPGLLMGAPPILLNDVLFVSCRAGHINSF
jgi:hypothetical protein